MVTRPYHTQLEFDVGGKANISEHIGDDKSFSYEELLDIEMVGDIDLEFGYSDDPDYSDDVGFFVQLGAYHQKNPDTSRVFHTHITARIGWEELQKIRDYCDFLLRNKPE